MRSLAARNQNSVQVSLSELRQIHVARIEADREAEADRRRQAAARAAEAERRHLLEEREREARRVAAEEERERARIAAEHELELARERLRVEAEARLQEKRLELQLRQADAELLKAQGMTPRRRPSAPSWAVLVVFLGLGGLLMWQQHQFGAERERATARIATLGEDSRTQQRTLASLEASLREAEEAARRAEERAAALDARLAEATHAADKPAPAPAQARPTRPASSTRDRPRPPATPPPPAIKDLSKCADTPLGCL